MKRMLMEAGSTEEGMKFHCMFSLPIIFPFPSICFSCIALVTGQPVDAYIWCTQGPMSKKPS